MSSAAGISLRIAFAVATAGIHGAFREARAETELERYYAHPAATDRHGVIASWWKGQNGPLDERIRIAAGVYKRYPWTEPGKAARAAPHIIYNTHWKISAQGEITVPPTDEWMCGDLGQRSMSIIEGLTGYYRYSGDPLAFLGSSG